jgi:hypothetical protein
MLSMSSQTHDCILLHAKAAPTEPPHCPNLNPLVTLRLDRGAAVSLHDRIANRFSSMSTFLAFSLRLDTCGAERDGLPVGANLHGQIHCKYWEAFRPVRSVPVAVMTPSVLLRYSFLSPTQPHHRSRADIRSRNINPLHYSSREFASPATLTIGTL